MQIKLAKHKKPYFKRKGGEKVEFLYWNILYKKMKNDLIRKNYSFRTVRNSRVFWKRFFDFIKVKKIFCISNLKHEDIIDFILTLSFLAPQTINWYISYLKLFLKYLYLHRLHDIDLTLSIPKMRKYTNKNIPHTIWSEEEVNKILNSVDVNTTVGKRDYAILMLISHLGLRISDIRELKFNNIACQRNTISLVQHKTKKLVVLPLFDDVGVSLINYIKYARPNVNSPYIFLTTTKPFRPFCCDNNFNTNFKKYLSLANIDISNKRLVGVHSLRHSLSNILLQNNIPLSTISPILGHSNIESTSIYLKVDIENLRQCCLTLEVLANG